MYARPGPLSMFPHDGAGGCTPRPRKLSDASIVMAAGIEIEARTINNVVTCGKT